MDGLGRLRRWPDVGVEGIEQRFDIACKRLGFNAERGRDLDKTLFRVPGARDQMTLF